MVQQSMVLLERAIALSYEACADPERWKDFVQVTARSCDAVGCALFTPGLDPGLRRFSARWGSMRPGFAEYFGYWAEFDPWNCAVAGTGFFEVAGEVRFGCEFLEDSALLQTAYYNDHGRHYDSGHKLSLKVCDVDDAYAPETNLVLGRPLSRAGFDDQDKQRMRILWPHLRRAVHTHWMLQRAREMPRAASGALEALPLPAWILRADATIEYSNATARALEASGAWQCGHGRRMYRIGDLDAAAIAETVRLAAAGCVRVLAINDRSGLKRAVLRIAPISEVALYLAAWPRAHALLILEMPHEQAQQQWLKPVVNHYSLTQAEGRILEQLATGETVVQIAVNQGINPSTVRTHLRSLFAKTGRNRQSDLVRLALGH